MKTSRTIQSVHDVEFPEIARSASDQAEAGSSEPPPPQQYRAEAAERLEAINEEARLKNDLVAQCQAEKD